MNVKSGAWIVTNHWRGPVVCVEKVTAKRVALVGGGYVKPQDVKAVFATEADAEAGVRRQREAWRAAQEELKPYEQARRDAIAAYLAKERELRAASWAAAQAAQPSTQPGE